MENKPYSKVNPQGHYKSLIAKLKKAKTDIDSGGNYSAIFIDKQPPVCGRFQRKRIYRIWFASLRLAYKLRKQKRWLYYLQRTIYLAGKKARKPIGSAVSLI